MKILNKPLRLEFALPGNCEMCGLPCKKREPHHHYTSTPEMTIRCNMVSLGSTLDWQCNCHSYIHSGRIPRIQVLERIAAREHQRPEDISAVLDLFRRLVKPTKFDLGVGLTDLGDRARHLAQKELLEAGLWEEVDGDA